jgi:hypothetical protein
VYLNAADSAKAFVMLGWDVRDRLQARRVVHAGVATNDEIQFGGGEIVRFSGGHGVDTVVLTGDGFTWDLRDIAPTRLESIERIDLTGPGNHVLVLDDAHIRMLPSSRPDAPPPMAKTLMVLGDAGDTVRLDLTGFDDLGIVEGRRILRRHGAYYGLELAEAIEIEWLDAR